VGHGERHCAQHVTVGSAEPAGFRARTTLPGRENGIRAANGAAYRRRRQITGAKLYASDFRAAICRDGRPRHRTRFSSAFPDATTSTPARISRVSAGAEAVVVVTAEELAKIGVRVSRILYRRSVLPGRQTRFIPASPSRC